MRLTKFLSRESGFPLQELFLKRISYRAFGDERLTEEELLSLFEAARWAPSSYNNQPWRFVYVRSTDPEWNDFFNTLVDFNKLWCKRADTLVVVITKHTFDHNGKPSATASFDTGAAWMSLALEATSRNIIAHAMEGFDKKEMEKLLHISEPYSVQAMIAIGKRGKTEDLPEELQKEEKPSNRRPLAEILFRGKFTPRS